MIRSFNDLDLPERLSGLAPRLVIEIAIAVLFVAIAGILRFGIELVAPGVAPFVLLFPALVAATLLGGWRCGVATLLMGAAGAWRVVLKAQLPTAQLPDLISLALFAVSGGLIVLFASLFRASVRQLAAERQREIEGRDLLLREFNHRVKNNFQIAGSILRLQRKRVEDPIAQAALDEAIGRLQGVAEVNANLYAPGGDAEKVDLRGYLGALCQALLNGPLAGSAVALKYQIAPVSLDRDRAGALGLIVNELVTNAFKYGFPDQMGVITVDFAVTPAGARLVVVDDGCGLPAGYAQSTGLGRKLVAAFARQARGELSWSNTPGARFQLDLPAL